MLASYPPLIKLDGISNCEIRKQEIRKQEFISLALNIEAKSILLEPQLTYPAGAAAGIDIDLVTDDEDM